MVPFFRGESNKLLLHTDITVSCLICDMTLFGVLFKFWTDLFLVDVDTWQPIALPHYFNSMLATLMFLIAEIDENVKQEQEPENKTNTNLFGMNFISETDKNGQGTVSTEGSEWRCEWCHHLPSGVADDLKVQGTMTAE